MKTFLICIAVVLGTALIVWHATEPPGYYILRGHVFGEPSPELMAANIGDVISTQVITIAPEIPGQDEIIQLPGTDKVLVSARDEWVWMVDLVSGKAEQFARAPLSPTGAKLVPGEPTQVYFCMARLDWNQYPGKTPGLYRLDLNTREFTEVITRVPLTGNMREDGLELPNFRNPQEVMVYPQPYRETELAALDASNSRPLQFCNDLDVTPDGKHIYITEPYSNPKASSGLGAVLEAVTLARNGRVWRFATDSGKVGLSVENIVFADGILLELDKNGRETGLLISETTNFQIGRAHLRGDRAGGYEVLWQDLPGLPDGLDRDAEGRVWVGLIKDRTPVVTWLHANPWLKPLVLRLPADKLPVARGTGIMVLNADATEVIAYSHHDGSRVVDISVAAPAGDKLFLPSFYKGNQGLHYLDINAVLSRVGQAALQ